MSLFSELKRRNVFRVAIAYLAVAWLLTEVAGTLFPVFGVPDWGVRFIVILFALGFLPTLIFSWVYELTPEGLKREKDIVREASITQLTAKRLDGITIGIIAVAIAFIAVDRIWLDSQKAPQDVEVPAAKEENAQNVESPLSSHSTPELSIAVLPFTNRSAKPDDEYFVDGIHDDLLTHIAKIGAIKTISRTSVMRYRDSTKTIPEIARELGVFTILEGGVQRAGDQIRINVQLIDAQTDEHLWAEIYDRELTAENIFAIQSEIAEAITAALKALLSPAEQERIQIIPTRSLEAYEAFLLGKQRHARMDMESLSEAVEFYRQAIAHDPSFALAWIGLADVYLELAGQKEYPIKETRAEAEAALNTALELDEGLGEAYTSLGHLRWRQNDLEGAKQYYERAFEFSPNYAPLSRLYSILLGHVGQYEESMRWRARAVELDPMLPELRRSYAVALREVGRIEDAMEQLNIALEIDPDFYSAHDAIATIQWQWNNRLDQAAKGFTEVINLNPMHNSGYVWLAQLYLDLAQPERASALIQRAVRLAPDDRVTVWGKLLLQLYIEPGETAAEMASSLTILPDPFGAPWHAQLAAASLSYKALAENRPMEALAVYSNHYPELKEGQEPDLNLENYRAAIDLALALQKTGNPVWANRLLTSATHFIKGRPRLGWWGGFWISDVQILALQGRKKEALAALRQATDEGWRSLWWYYLRYDPNLESIRGEPEFQHIVARIEVDMSAQMQRVREMERSNEILDVPGVNLESK